MSLGLRSGQAVPGRRGDRSGRPFEWTFLARKYWGGRYNAEMKRLLLNHAFTFVQNVVFYVGEKNIRSQKAMEKIGAIRKGNAARAYGNHPPALNVKYVIQKRDTLRLEGQGLSE